MRDSEFGQQRHQRGRHDRPMIKLRGPPDRGRSARPTSPDLRTCPTMERELPTGAALILVLLGGPTPGLSTELAIKSPQHALTT